MPEKGNTKGRQRPGDLAGMLAAVMTHPRCPVEIWGRIVDGLEAIHKRSMVSAYTDPKIIRELLRLHRERER